MKAITLHQPWATLMAIGAKRIETRSWWTGYRGPLAIHAAAAFPGYAKDACYSRPMIQALGWPLAPNGRPTQEWLGDIHARMKALPLGAIVATVELVGFMRTDPFCAASSLENLWLNGSIVEVGEHELALGNYEAGRWGWITRNFRAIDPPIPAHGKQGLWDWREAEAVI